MKSSRTTDHLSLETSFLKYRKGGILVHLTSLPGKYGIGDLGSEFYRFIDFLHSSRQHLLQILPLGPTGYGNSPYQSFSTFAGNPLLISPEKLIDLGLLSFDEINIPKFPEIKVEFGKVFEFKSEILNKAYTNFTKNLSSSVQTQYKMFLETHNYWLEDFALFMSIKEEHDLRAWNTWEESLRIRDSSAISSWKKSHQEKIEFHKFSQFLFFQQWNDAKNYAHKKKVRIIGDIPIFVAYDSADVWSNPHLFYLDNHGEMEYVAGVPPDYFSETGQRWGNPIYRWDRMQKNGYKWWIKRINHNFSLVDILRIDHFRGFEAYWQIPAEETTAINGKWVKGPGINLFLTLKKVCGFLPVIAENLGIITPAVDELLQQTGFPGMRVLQFAFGIEEEEYIGNDYLPHNYIPNTVVYTGTHDNDTTLGWFRTVPKEVKQEVLSYLNSDGEDIVRDLIRLAWSSVAKISIIPLQDLLRLGSEGRMNYPGTESHNWEWRFTWEQLTNKQSKEIARLSKIYQRHVS
ncbi:MAG: 4-alpha-glucanotransferase [Candidatus Heimdallarchaeota archaeon]|nr:MAG: 4-alpha-glucanotransferase [Candidatus Heimdallarchaeota archaeon]